MLHNAFRVGSKQTMVDFLNVKIQDFGVEIPQENGLLLAVLQVTGETSLPGHEAISVLSISLDVSN